MKINKVLILIAVVMASMYSYGQQVDSKLSVVYSPEQINHFKQSNPDMIKFANFYVNNASYITDAPEGKTIETTPLRKINPKTGEILQDEIRMIDLQDFNVYLYNCKSKANSNTFYTIGNTGKILVMRSNAEISRLFKQSKNSNN